MMVINKTQMDGIAAFMRGDTETQRGRWESMYMCVHEGGQSRESTDHVLAWLVYVSSGALVTSLLHHDELSAAGVLVCV